MFLVDVRELLAGLAQDGLFGGRFVAGGEPVIEPRVFAEGQDGGEFARFGAEGEAVEQEHRSLVRPRHERRMIEHAHGLRERIRRVAGGIERTDGDPVAARGELPGDEGKFQRVRSRRRPEQPHTLRLAIHDEVHPCRTRRADRSGDPRHHGVRAEYLRALGRVQDRQAHGRIRRGREVCVRGAGGGELRMEVAGGGSGWCAVCGPLPGLAGSGVGAGLSPTRAIS